MILIFQNHILLYQNDSVFTEPNSALSEWFCFFRTISHILHYQINSVFPESYSALSEWFCFSRTTFCFIRIIFYAHLTQPYKIQYIGWVKWVVKMILFFQNLILLYQNDYVFPEPHSAISESFSRGISYLINQWIITGYGYPKWLTTFDYPKWWIIFVIPMT